jgi:ABC-2 type transport system ATP-binding protein
LRLKIYKKYKNAEEFSVNDISLNIEKDEIYGILGLTEPEKQL